MANLFKEKNRRNTCCYKWDLSQDIIGVDKNEVNSFWIADSDYETCPEVKKDLIKRAKHGAFGYTYVGSEYMDILSNWVEKHYGYKVNKDNTVLTSGVVNALYFIVQLFTSVNDNVLVNPPVYNPFYDVILKNNRNVIYSPLTRKELDDNMFTYEIDFNDLEEKISQAKMYILCNPHNPVGRCYSYEEIERIVSLCKKYNCILVSDEIHCDLIMPGYTFTSAGKFFNEYENIIICTAPSKTFNVAGLGNSNIFLNNKEMFKKYDECFANMSMIKNIFGLEAAMSAYAKGEKWVEKQNEFLATQARLVYDFAKENNVKVCKLEGTYLMWLDLSRLGLTQEELIKGLISKKIWINTGTNYDKDAIGFIRVNVACSKKQLVKGLSLISEFIKECDK